MPIWTGLLLLIVGYVLAGIAMTADEDRNRRIKAGTYVSRRTRHQRSARVRDQRELDRLQRKLSGK